MSLATTPYGKFYYFEPDAIGQSIAAGDFWDAHLRPCMDELLSGDVLIDVGANIGFFTVYCSLFLGATVHAFEPSPDVFALLERNVQLNNLQNVYIYNVALYHKAMTLRLNPKWDDWGKTTEGNIDYENSPNSGGLSLVPGTDGTFVAAPLDSYGFEKVNLLKVDAQGSDLRVLVGGRETIKRCHPAICFEFEHDGSGKNASGDTFDDFREFFIDIDYRIHCVRGDEYGLGDYVARYQK